LTGGAKHNPGTFIIPAEGNPSDTNSQLESAAKDLGICVKSVGADPSATLQ
jgi:hypothetical protein